APAAPARAVVADTSDKPSASEPTAATGPAARPKARLHAAIVDVEEAPDMDAAVGAYAAGLAIDANSIALHKAYLRRVIDLDVPQLGISAAQHILDVEPNHGLARGLAAYIEARQGQMAEAM